MMRFGDRVHSAFNSVASLARVTLSMDTVDSLQLTFISCDVLVPLVLHCLIITVTLSDETHYDFKKIYIFVGVGGVVVFSFFWKFLMWKLREHKEIMCI